MATKTVRSKSQSTKTLPYARGKKPREQGKKANSAAEMPAKMTFTHRGADYDVVAVKKGGNVPPQQAPVPKTEPVYLFDGDATVNRDAPLSKLIVNLFASTNAPEFQDPAKNLMANVLCSMSDDANFMAGINDGMDNTELIQRAAYRLETRALMAVEIARRIDAGEVKS